MKPIACIAGVAESDLGVTGSRSVGDIQSQAILAALADAGIEPSEVDGLFTNGIGRFPAMFIAEYTGLKPRITDSTAMGGSSYEAFVGHAAEMIRAGVCEVAVVSYGSNQKSARLRSLGGFLDPAVPSGQFDEPFAPLNPMSMYAMAAHRHMHEFGTTSEQLAEVAVSARQWALKNPKAYRHAAGELTIDDVLSSPVISSPLHTLDCCLVVDGGGAVVLVHPDRARDLPKPAVNVCGWGEETTHFSMSQAPGLDKLGGYRSSARAYAMAGISPSDVDLAMLYDSFTITVLLQLEACGLVPRGEAGRFVEDGKTRPGGSFPLNTSGGGLSYCHPGMYGIFLLIEATRQLRGECGDRQVECEVALCNGVGGILSSYSTVVLSK